MFAYCNNVPILSSDPTGHEMDWWQDEYGYPVADGTAALVMPYGYGTYIGDVGYSTSMTPATSSTYSYLVRGIAAASTVAMVGSCLSPAAYPSKDDDDEDQRFTYIYRWGGTSPSNLTPSQRDVDLYPITGKGLSFSLVPGPGKNVMTTIEVLNATGVVYAICDGGNHVSVFPIDGTLEDWYKAGSSSKWTKAVKAVVVKWYGAN